MSEPPSKASLRKALEQVLTSDLETLARAHRATQEGATHEEAKPENDKDTRALEQSYLARGQAMRVQELQAALADVRAMPVQELRPTDSVGIGAVVRAEEDGVSLELWIAPHGGGARLGVQAVQVVTPKSPMGRALIGKRAGDTCELSIAGRSRELTILSVR